VKITKDMTEKDIDAMVEEFKIFGLKDPLTNLKSAYGSYIPNFRIDPTYVTFSQYWAPRSSTA
jgi:hypothetical protein